MLFYLICLLQQQVAAADSRSVNITEHDAQLAAAAATTNATCAALQSRIIADRPGLLKDISCHLLAKWESTKRSRGCECRLLQINATGAACPYDCTSSGVPACVEGAAKALGLSGLTAGEPVAVPQRLGKKNLEAFTCTYWSFTLDLGKVDSDADERARVQGRLKFAQLMKRLGDSVEPKVDEKIQAMKADMPPTFTFNQSLQNVSDGGPEAWAHVGQVKVDLKNVGR